SVVPCIVTDITDITENPSPQNFCGEGFCCIHPIAGGGVCVCAHCSQRCPGGGPVPDSPRGNTRSVWLCSGRVCRPHSAGIHPHPRPRTPPGTGHGCPAGSPG